MINLQQSVIVYTYLIGTIILIVAIQLFAAIINCCHATNWYRIIDCW